MGWKKFSTDGAIFKIAILLDFDWLLKIFFFGFNKIIKKFKILKLDEKKLFSVVTKTPQNFNKVLLTPETHILKKKIQSIRFCSR